MKKFAFQEQPAASSAPGMILLTASQPAYHFGGAKSISATATEQMERKVGIQPQ